MSTIFTINLSVMSKQLHILSTLLGVSQLHFRCDFDVADGPVVDAINDFELFENEQCLTSFKHDFLEHNDEIKDDLTSMICENILSHTNACLTNDLYRVFTTGIIDFIVNEIEITSCYGDEYVSRVEEFTLREGQRLRYNPTVFSIYLEDEFYKMANEIESKPKSNIKIETIKI